MWATAPQPTCCSLRLGVGERTNQLHRALIASDSDPNLESFDTQQAFVKLNKELINSMTAFGCTVSDSSDQPAENTVQDRGSSWT
jgi:hypothetical protein